MATPRPPKVVLSERERVELERLVRAFTTGQQLALRARIVLAAESAEKKSSKVSCTLASTWNASNPKRARSPSVAVYCQPTVVCQIVSKRTHKAPR